MIVDFRLVAAICALMVGLLVMWANPGRRLNRAFFGFSLFVVGWLLCQWWAGQSAHGLWWVRMTFAFAVCPILMMWLVKQVAAEPEIGLDVQARRLLPWVIVGGVLMWICFTEYFVPATSTSDRRQHGWGFTVYVVAIVAMVLGVFVQTLFQLRTLTGMRRLELQQLLVGSSAAALAVIVLVILGAVTGNSAFNKAQSIFVLAFYAATSWAIVTSRILDARYLVAAGLEKLALAVAAASSGIVVYCLLFQLVPDLLALVIAAGLALWFTAVVEPYVRHAVGLHRSDVESRTAAHDVARLESRPERLEQGFVKVLQAWAKSERAVILTGRESGFTGAGIDLTADSPVPESMRELRWATPERLARERPSPKREAVAAFLRQQQLELLVIGEGLTLTVLVGVGVSASRRPFTYPQATQLLELAAIIESAMERAHFAIKVQHTEQLATVGLLGASLAHEIRNPLVTIKTFVQLLPQHHQDATFREKFFRLIGDEVGRIDRLTEQLLDMASPRTYVATMVELHPVLRASLDLVAAKAADKNIAFLTEFHASPDRAYTDASAAKQVMLNLCFNAIQAVESREGERWVRVSTRNLIGGIEMAVADSGPGVAQEIRPRLFQPFSTTKSSGFGLGLAICSDILANLNATISVDPAGMGTGATFRVIFPCQPQSS